MHDSIGNLGVQSLLKSAEKKIKEEKAAQKGNSRDLQMVLLNILQNTDKHMNMKNLLKAEERTLLKRLEWPYLVFTWGLK